MLILNIEGPLPQDWFRGEAQSTRGFVYRWFWNAETSEELRPFRLAGEATLRGGPAECWLDIPRIPAMSAAVRAMVTRSSS